MQAGGELRAGLLGTGVIAEPHAKFGQMMPGVRLVAVCDREREKASAFARRWDIPAVYGSLGEMLAAGLDVVHVLLPPAAHCRAAVECLERGCHVLIEKPMCLTSAECREVEHAAALARRSVGVNHNLVHAPAWYRMVDEIRARRLGRVEHVTVLYNVPLGPLTAGQHGHWMFQQPGNIFLELGPHPVSMVCRLLGRVTAASTMLSGEIRLRSGAPFYDTWQASLTCERGTAQLSLTLGREYVSRWCHVVGQDGEAWVDVHRNTFRLSEKTTFIRSENLWDAWSGARSVLGWAGRNFANAALAGMGRGWRSDVQVASMHASISAFYEALRENREPLIGVREGAAVVEACEAIIAS